jgi:hypothetical protein
VAIAFEHFFSLAYLIQDSVHIVGRSHRFDLRLSNFLIAHYGSFPNHTNIGGGITSHPDGQFNSGHVVDESTDNLLTTDEQKA